MKKVITSGILFTLIFCLMGISTLAETTPTPDHSAMQEKLLILEESIAGLNVEERYNVEDAQATQTMLLNKLVSGHEQIINECCGTPAGTPTPPGSSPDEESKFLLYLMCGLVLLSSCVTLFSSRRRN